jgi:hypothetical protein
VILAIHLAFAVGQIECHWNARRPKAADKAATTLLDDANSVNDEMARQPGLLDCR